MYFYHFHSRSNGQKKCKSVGKGMAWLGLAWLSGSSEKNGSERKSESGVHARVQTIWNNHYLLTKHAQVERKREREWEARRRIENQKSGKHTTTWWLPWYYRFLLLLSVSPSLSASLSLLSKARNNLPPWLSFVIIAIAESERGVWMCVWRTIVNWWWQTSTTTTNGTMAGEHFGRSNFEIINWMPKHDNHTCETMWRERPSLTDSMWFLFFAGFYYVEVLSKCIERWGYNFLFFFVCQCGAYAHMMRALSLLYSMLEIKFSFIHI